MKRLLISFVALCMAGIFSAKAQSASDSAFARDLSYTNLNIGTLPVRMSDTLKLTDKILKDLRSGLHAKGYSFSLSSTKCLDIALMAEDPYWDPYMYLLDSAYNSIDESDDWGYKGCRIIDTLGAGLYHIIITTYGEYNNDSLPGAYKLLIDELHLTPINQLTFTPIASMPDTLLDTFSTILNCQTILFDNDIYLAKGYSFQGTQDKMLNLYDDYNDAKYLLLDNNKNLIKSSFSYNFMTKLDYTGTYYLVIMNYWNAEVYISQQDLPVMYIDGINGNDTNTGLTVANALKTLDTAITRTNRLGTFYLTNDYTFSGNSVRVQYAEIYPYQKDIRLHLPTSGYDDIINVWENGTLVFGEANSNYHFIIDSSHATGFYNFLDGDDYGTYLEVNNLKVSNTFFPSNVFYGHNVKLNNCEFYKDTIVDDFIDLYYESGVFEMKNTTISQCELYDDFIMMNVDYCKVIIDSSTITKCTIDDDFIYLGEYCELTLKNSTVSQCNIDYNGFYVSDNGIISLENSTISQCDLGRGFYVSDNGIISLENSTVSQCDLGYGFFFNMPQGTFTMENSTVSGNSFEYPMCIWRHGTANLISGIWRNNNMTSTSWLSSIFSNPNLSTQNLAGIVLQDTSTVNIGAGFFMDVNNLILIDSFSTINITEKSTRPYIAQIYPYRHNFNTGYYENDYYEGRRLISGPDSILSANYQKFLVAQLDSAMWYLHPDGKIYTNEPPVSLLSAENTVVRMYPNPASNVLNIALEGSEVNEVVIIDIYGKTVVRNNVADGTNSLDISGLPAGMYFVQLCSNGQVEATKKLIKR